MYAGRIMDDTAVYFKLPPAGMVSAQKMFHRSIHAVQALQHIMYVLCTHLSRWYFPVTPEQQSGHLRSTARHGTCTAHYSTAPA